MSKFGIDVSHWQGNFNFKAAQDEGVEYAIIKAGGADDGYYVDGKFEQYYSDLRSIKMPTGAYYFAEAYTQDEAIKQAKHFVNLLGNKDFELPLFIDIEAGMLNAAGLTDLAMAFCNTVKEARPDCEVGVYTSVSHLNGKFNVKALSDAGLKMWVAYYSDENPVLKDGVNVDIWQYGGSVNFLRDTHVAGVVVDQNYCYMDIPAFRQHEEAPQPAPAVPESGLKYSIGEVVEYTHIHTTSSDNNALVPSINKGTITNIISGAANPYLINNGTGWVRESDIIVESAPVVQPQPEPVATTKYNKGDKIYVHIGAKDMNYNIRFANEVYRTEQEVIECTDSYIVFGKNGVVIGKISIDDVAYNHIPNPSSPSPSNLKPVINVGDTVKVNNPVDTRGVSFALWYDKYTVQEVGDGNVVIGIGAVPTARISTEYITKL